MPSFAPKRNVAVSEETLDLKSLFSDEIYSRSLKRVCDYLYGVYLKHSDGSYGRVSRSGEVTEQFFLEMPTIDAYVAEVTLLRAIRAHALGKLDDESIKVCLKKYLESHTLIYRETRSGWIQENKTGPSSWTDRNDVPLFEVRRTSQEQPGGIFNGIQLMIFLEFQKRAGNDVTDRIHRL